LFVLVGRAAQNAQPGVTGRIKRVWAIVFMMMRDIGYHDQHCWGHYAVIDTKTTRGIGVPSASHYWRLARAVPICLSGADITRHFLIVRW
jgi:hypothetical protein